MIDRKTAEAWKEWLGQMRWAFFATGTWERPVSQSTSQRTVDTWLSVFPEAFAAVGVQRGPTSLSHHVHLLIGGVNPIGATLLRRTWVKHGHVLVDRYDPTQDAIGYMVRQADDIHLIGHLQRFRPRRARRKNPTPLIESS